jgi:acyl-coenzyme A synthetase/AMP-(fatty) acid ligase
MTFLTSSRLDDLFPLFERMDNEACAIALAPAQPTLPQTPDPERDFPEESWLGVTSSGSTGLPRLIWKKWSDLRSSASRKHLLLNCPWASPFQPWTYAGVMVALQAWVGNSTILSLTSDWDSNWQDLLRHQIQAISCTPTFLDLQMQSVGLASREANPWSPIQITLGGEPLRPGLGLRLTEWFPKTRYTVIYATAELGTLLKSHTLDGWYDIASLESRFTGWRLVQGTLEVLIDERWVSSSDTIEIHDGKMRVIGRSDNVANVAGSKVNLAEISRLAEEVPGILHAVAVAENSSITGQIVCLKYALINDANESSGTQRRLEEHLRKHLPKEAWPRRWVQSAVGMGPNSKRALT